MSLSEETCLHCGDDIVEAVKLDEKRFCCEGCKSVYQIIHGAGLQEFYVLSQNPGVKQQKSTPLDFLKNETLVEGLLDYNCQDYSIVTFVLPSIHCASCVWLLERLPELNRAIIGAEIHFFKKRVTIRYDHKQLSLFELAELLQRIGYQPNFGNRKEGKNNKSLIIKIGVSGFVFGNIMLLSFPEYVSEFNTPELKKFFSYLSVVLILPVLFYSSTVFYKNVWQSFKARMISIDIPVVLGIISLFVRSLYDIFYLEETGYLDSLAGLVFFLLLGKWFQGKVYDELSFEKSASDYLPLGILVRKTDAFEMIPLKEVDKDDVIRIRTNEVVPFDVYALSDEAYIDTSFITGESIPEHVRANQKVYCGSKILNGFLDAKVANKERGDLFDVWQEGPGHSKLDNSLVKHFTWIVLLLGVLTFAYHYVLNGAETAFVATTSVWIVACPCALALVDPTAWGLYIRRLSKLGYFLKSADVVERLRNIKKIVFDKTGTITGKDFTTQWQGDPLSMQEGQVLVAMCNQAIHPITDIIASTFGVVNHSNIVLEDFKENPGAGMRAVVRGHEYVLGKYEYVHGLKENTSIKSIQVWMKKDQKILGKFSIEIQNRVGLDQLFKGLKKHYSIHLLSGDSSLDLNEFEKWFGKSNIVKGASPKEKLSNIQKLQEDGGVLMIGDGLNDSLALQKADVGIAVVEGNGAFFPECDGICFGNELLQLDKVLQLVRNLKRIKIYSYTFSIIYNSIGFYLAFNLMLSPLIASILMPLSSLTVVGVIWLSYQFFSRRIA